MSRAVDRSTNQFWTLFAKGHSRSNFPFISSLKILTCATNRDSLLLATLQYTFLGSKWVKIEILKSECTECLLMQGCVIKLGCIVNDIAFFWDHYFTWLHICRVVWPHFKRMLLHILTGLPLGPKPTTSPLKSF